MLATASINTRPTRAPAPIEVRGERLRPRPQQRWMAAEPRPSLGQSRRSCCPRLHPTAPDSGAPSRAGASTGRPRCGDRRCVQRECKGQSAHRDQDAASAGPMTKARSSSVAQALFAGPHSRLVPDEIAAETPVARPKNEEKQAANRARAITDQSGAPISTRAARATMISRGRRRSRAVRPAGRTGRPRSPPAPRAAAALPARRRRARQDRRAGLERRYKERDEEQPVAD